MTLKIEEGRYYVNRIGEKVGPMGLNACIGSVGNKNEYPFLAAGTLYTATGAYYINGAETDRDLVAEWTDHAGDGEWGEWREVDWQLWRAQREGKDYKYRSINGVREYRLRKPRRVTMLVDVIDGTPDLSTLRPVKT